MSLLLECARQSKYELTPVSSVLSANGGWKFWVLFAIIFAIAMVSPVLENGWLRIWSASYSEPATHSGLYYIGIYCLITIIGGLSSSPIETFLHEIDT